MIAYAKSNSYHYFLIDLHSNHLQPNKLYALITNCVLVRFALRSAYAVVLHVKNPHCTVKGDPKGQLSNEHCETMKYRSCLRTLNLSTQTCY